MTTPPLPTAAEMAALDPFPGVDLAATADGVQEAVFKLGSGLQPTERRNYFQVNNYAFHDARVRYVELGRTEMWSLSTRGDPVGVPGGGIPPLPHVFHIHINPFQVSRTGPDGQLGMMEAVEVVERLPLPHPRPDGTPGAGAGHGGHGSH